MSIFSIRKTSPPALPDVDLTRVWDHCHPHLRPFRNHLPLASSDNVTLAHGGQGVLILAHLRFGDAGWSADPARIIYDFSLDRFYLAAAEAQRLQPSKAHQAERQVTAVNARLWFSEPTFLNLEPTTRCNFNCWYCIGRHMKQEDIQLDNFAAALDHFPALKTLALVGEGEPLLHKDFFVMARLAKARDIRVMIISNGSALSRSVVKELCETGVDYVSVSIDSANPETFASSRLDGKLEQVWRGIENLRSYRDAHGYRFPKIALKGTLFANTESELPSIVAAAKAHGVEVFESFQPLNPMHSYVRIYPAQHLKELAYVDRVAKAIARDGEAARREMQPVEEFCAEIGIEFGKCGQANPLRPNCDEQWIYSLLSGDITPCCQIKTPISPHWNLFQHNLDDILADPEYENIRFNLWNGLFPRYCEGCWKTRC